MSTIAALNVHEVPRVVYNMTLQVSLDGPEDTAEPSYDRGAVLLYELGPSLHLLLVYFDRRSSHLQELLQAMEKTVPTTACMEASLHRGASPRVAVMLHDVKIIVDEGARTATFACTNLGPAVYRIYLHFERITDFWDFSQLVVERKKVGAFYQQRVDCLVHRAAEMIPNHPIVIPSETANKEEVIEGAV